MKTRGVVTGGQEAELSEVCHILPRNETGCTQGRIGNRKKSRSTRSRGGSKVKHGGGVQPTQQDTVRFS